CARVGGDARAAQRLEEAFTLRPRADGDANDAGELRQIGSVADEDADASQLCEQAGWIGDAQQDEVAWRGHRVESARVQLAGEPLARVDALRDVARGVLDIVERRDR